MSIVTKSGDQGATGLMFNRRVSKCHPRVEACGSVDELNAAIGLARATAVEASVQNQLLGIQRVLVALMGELATSVEDLERYTQAGFAHLTPDDTAKLETLVAELESRHPALAGWAIPGGTIHSAAVDMARTVCRRAERRVCSLSEAGELRNREILIYLNRLSDLLWLLARSSEGLPATGTTLV